MSVIGPVQIDDGAQMIQESQPFPLMNKIPKWCYIIIMYVRPAVDCSGICTDFWTDVYTKYKKKPTSLNKWFYLQNDTHFSKKINNISVTVSVTHVFVLYTLTYFWETV